MQKSYGDRTIQAKVGGLWSSVEVVTGEGRGGEWQGQKGLIDTGLWDGWKADIWRFS